jgi:3-oxoacyl-[acyl-carrier protein] reductase
MDLQLRGKTALVTGASMGIGWAIAKGLAREGVRLAIAARRADLLERLADEIADAGAERPVVVIQDMMAEDAHDNIRAACEAGLGSIDILINNAGGSNRIKFDSPDAVWLPGQTLNYVRPRQLTQALLPGMIKRGWGRIINITGKSEPDFVTLAGPAKAAMHAWAKELSREIGKFGITINAIAPGRIMSEQIRQKYSEEFQRAFAEKNIPVGYWGEPDDLAVLAVFLASPLAHYITGTVMPVDGGLRRYQY